MSNTAHNNFVKIAEAAKILKVHKDTLRRWEKAGRIKVIRDENGNRLYDFAELAKIAVNNIPVIQNSSTPLVKNIKPITTEELLKSAAENNQDGFNLINQDYLSVLAGTDQNTSKNNIVFGKNLRLLNILGISLFVIVVGTAFMVNRVVLTPQHPTQTQVADSAGLLNQASVLGLNTKKALVNFNSDVEIVRNLTVSGTTNGVKIATNPSGFSIATNSGSLTVKGDIALDQNVSTTSSPSFTNLKLSASSNQLAVGGANIAFPSSSTTLVGTKHYPNLNQ